MLVWVEAVVARGAVLDIQTCTSKRLQTVQKIVCFLRHAIMLSSISLWPSIDFILLRYRVINLRLINFSKFEICIYFGMLRPTAIGLL